MDIASGSPRSRQAPSYALFVLDGVEGERHSMISRHKLIRLVREMHPEIIAVDNVYELASDRGELVNLLRQLPFGTKLVQVTGGDRPSSLAKVAKWHGMTFDRLDPLDEAEVCARLAAKGVGQVLSAFEDRTWIKVSRRRSPGRGGWSQNRYSRKIHGSVKGLAREVERQIKESGASYTSKAVEGLGGYIRCEFVVEALRDKIHVKPGFYEDAQVRVEGIERPRLQFRPLQQRRGYIIAGVDPGTTTGVAALDLRGELVDLLSARAMSPSDVVEWLSARGKPLILATDVFPTPGAVEKIKRSFQAVLYSPGEAVPGEEKILLARPFGYKNDHERDALAAAFSAFKRYRNKFSQVDKKCPPEVDPDEVKALVVKGYSIDAAISALTLIPQPSPVSTQPAEEVDADVSALRSQNQQMVEQIKNLRSYVEELRSELAVKDQAVADLKGRLERIKDKSLLEVKRDHEIKIRDKEIARLRGLLRSERKFIKRLKAERARAERAQEVQDKQGYLRLKPVEAFSKEAILAAAERWSLGEGDIILLKNASGGGPNTADLLVQMGVLAVITQGEMPLKTKEYLSQKGIPVFSEGSLPLEIIDDMAFLKPEDLEAAKARWEEGRRAKEAEAKVEWLEGMIKDYRVTRRKEEQRARKDSGKVQAR